jgi:hypothetical protein
MHISTAATCSLELIPSISNITISDKNTRQISLLITGVLRATSCIPSGESVHDDSC